MTAVELHRKLTEAAEQVALTVELLNALPPDSSPRLKLKEVAEEADYALELLNELAPETRPVSGRSDSEMRDYVDDLYRRDAQRAWKERDRLKAHVLERTRTMDVTPFASAGGMLRFPVTGPGAFSGPVSSTATGVPYNEVHIRMPPGLHPEYLAHLIERQIDEQVG